MVCSVISLMCERKTTIMTDAVSGVKPTTVPPINPAKTDKAGEPAPQVKPEGTPEGAVKTEGAVPPEGAAAATSPIAPNTPPGTTGSVAQATPTDAQAKKLDMYA